MIKKYIVMKKKLTNLNNYKVKKLGIGNCINY